MILILITIMASVSFFFCRLSFGGIVLRHYLEANVSRKTKTSIKYFMKMLANISETIIFMFLGLSTLGEDLDWNWSFICFSLLFCLVFRVLGKQYLIEALYHCKLFTVVLWYGPVVVVVFHRKT